MASYETEHHTYQSELQAERENASTAGTRLSRNEPLLASFFSTDRLTAQPALFSDLARAFQSHEPAENSLMTSMISQLLAEAQGEETSSGLDQQFLDSLDRVDTKTLTKDDSCPICATPYLDDKYPLVVRLKCSHQFDLECITPWLKLHTTCPMCRGDVRKSQTAPIQYEDSEEEYDNTYG